MRKDKPSTRTVKGKLEREGTRKLHDVDIDWTKMTVRTFLTKRLERGREREKRNKYSEIERRFTEMFSLVSVFKVCN